MSIEKEKIIITKSVKKNRLIHALMNNKTSIVSKNVSELKVIVKLSLVTL